MFLSTLTSLRVWWKKKIGNSIKILRSDQGEEYKSREFNQNCKINGTLQQFTVPHTPW